jgi:hypothetical protein
MILVSRIEKKKLNFLFDVFVEHYRELGLLKRANPNLKISIRLGGKVSAYTRFLKHPNMATQLVRSLIW